MRLTVEAAKWFEAGKADAEAGRLPQCVLDGKLPEEHGRDYNAGYRAGGGPWRYALGKGKT